MMRIIVIGGKGLAEQVADALHRAGDEVTVIESEPGREPALAKAGLQAMHGDALVPTTLEAAGALRADVLVACTQSDEDNLVISLLAKKRFNVPRVIARVNDPANDELFQPLLGGRRAGLAGDITRLDDQARDLTPRRPAARRPPSRPRPEGATFGPPQADQRPCRCG